MFKDHRTLGIYSPGHPRGWAKNPIAVRQLSLNFLGHRTCHKSYNHHGIFHMPLYLKNPFYAPLCFSLSCSLLMEALTSNVFSSGIQNTPMEFGNFLALSIRFSSPKPFQAACEGDHSSDYDCIRVSTSVLQQPFLNLLGNHLQTAFPGLPAI